MKLNDKGEFLVDNTDIKIPDINSLFIHLHALQYSFLLEDKEYIFKTKRLPLWIEKYECKNLFNFNFNNKS
jgi:hypothetical protein